MYQHSFNTTCPLAITNGWIVRDPFYNYKVKFKWVDREFLSEEELQRLVDLEINWPRIDMVRDMFVFCCYTGLAYIDVKNLTQDNLVKNIDVELWIEAKRTKTDAKFGIPLLPTTVDTLWKIMVPPLDKPS